MRLLTAFLLLIFTLPAHARLGETEDQCITRYGTPTKICNPGEQGTICNYRTLKFSKGDYVLSAGFLNGHCGVIGFWKQDQSEFSSDEIQILLDANADGHTWQKKDGKPTELNWSRDDGCEALYTSQCLILMSKEVLADQTAQKKADEAKKLNGF